MAAGGFRLCVGERTIAKMEFFSTGCSFDDRKANPCNAAACQDGLDSEGCLQYTAQYCANHDDKACDLFLLRFERTTSELTDLAVHVSSDFKPTALNADFVPLGEPCPTQQSVGTGCRMWLDVNAITAAVALTVTTRAWLRCKRTRPRRRWAWRTASLRISTASTLLT
jgi:hypothetical protein